MPLACRRLDSTWYIPRGRGTRTRTRGRAAFARRRHREHCRIASLASITCAAEDSKAKLAENPQPESAIPSASTCISGQATLASPALQSAAHQKTAWSPRGGDRGPSTRGGGNAFAYQWWKRSLAAVATSAGVDQLKPLIDTDLSSPSVCTDSLSLPASLMELRSLYAGGCDCTDDVSAYPRGVRCQRER